MGRLTTWIAATATHADNLPGKLPNVSALDVFSPRGLTSRKNTNSSSTSLLLPNTAAVGNAEIKRDSKGRLVMVRHRGSSTNVITFEDVKKSVDKMKEQDGSGEKKSESISKQGGEKKDDAEDKGDGKEKSDGWTAEEDAKLREFKNNGKTTPWKDISADMGKEVEDLRARWAVLRAADKESGCEDKKVETKEKPDDKKTEDSSKGKGGKGGKQGDQKKNDEKKNGGGGHQQKMDQFVFTEEQDKELRECMAAGTNWKLTAKAVKRSQDACKQRWEQIKGDVENKEEPKKDETNKDEPKTDEPKKEEAGKKDKPVSKPASQKGAKKPASVVKAPSKAASAAGSIRSSRSSVKFSISEWRALQEDDFFSFEELQILCQLIGKHGDRSWLGIASAFHDKTGRRVHPEDIREKFEAI